MTKYPFTAAGFHELQQELYALSNSALQLEADAILSDFTLWMNAHFILSPTQVSFLNGTNMQFRNFTAFQTSVAVANRLPVNLIKPLSRSEGDGEEPEPEPDVDGKIIRTKSKLTSGSDDEGGLEIDGEVDIEIEYLT